VADEPVVVATARSGRLDDREPLARPAMPAVACWIASVGYRHGDTRDDDAAGAGTAPR